MAFAGCSKSTSTKTQDGQEVTKASNKIVGTWEMRYDSLLEEEGLELDEEDLEDYIDIDFSFTFNEDGTGAISMLGEQTDFTYEIDGDNIKLIEDGEDKEDVEAWKFNIDGDNLTLEYVFEDITETIELKRVK